jgi:eukaryotic-like serine/threonine-protein kinase
VQPRSSPSFSGRTFSDFEAREELGAGGMGVVYRAVDHKSGRTVALKFVHVDDADGRLLLEARAAAPLDHPNVGTIFGIEKGPGGELCIVMAPLSRRDPCEAHRTRTASPRRSRSNRGPDCSRTDGGARQGNHSSGRQTRNIFLASSGAVKVLDFGLAKITDRDQTVTKSGTLAGTTAYMSPQQVRGAGVDARSDAWSLGAVTYEMLTGRPPFHAPDTIRCCTQWSIKRLIR